MKKRVGVILMLFSIMVITNGKVHARGQPQNHGIVLGVAVEYIGTTQIETVEVVGENIMAINPGIATKNLTKEEMVMNIGIRRERDVDSCSVIPFLIKETPVLLVEVKYNLPSKFGLLNTSYC